jgi:pyruvate dehydrogenase E2 component (dihydrolipoamide acetyltransferase)
LREDVERFLAGLKAAPVAAAGAAVAPAAREAAVEAQLVRRAPLPPIPRREPGGPEEEILPYRGVRRQIGKKMAQSVYTAPHYTYVEEVDADALVALRREGQSLAEARGLKLTYLPFIVKALVPALRAFPLLNAVLDEERQQIRLKKRFNIGIATSSDEGLIVPVLKDVDQLSILEIASEIRRLSEAARDRSITIEELKGSTFTITSLGPLGGLLATPIINFPEVAILGVHAIKQKPVVKDGQIVIGNVMNLSLSFDHRVVDGAVGAEFTQRLVRYLEDPKLLLLDT